MSLSTFSPSVEFQGDRRTGTWLDELLRRHFDTNQEAHGGSTKYFNILGLPNEMISHIFSFLPIADRLRARLNRRLSAVEAETKYYVDRLVITERSNLAGPVISRHLLRWYDYFHLQWDECIKASLADGAQSIIFSDDKPYSSDFVRKIFENASIGELKICLSGREKIHRKIFDLIKESDIGHFSFRIRDRASRDQVMASSFVLNTARVCDALSSIYFPAEVIHRIYQSMLDGTSKLHTLTLTFGAAMPRFPFFRLIGITYREGKYYTAREIEVYTMRYGDDKFHSHIFDGRLEMVFGDVFTMRLHKTGESLSEAKHREFYRKVDVVRV